MDGLGSGLAGKFSFGTGPSSDNLGSAKGLSASFSPPPIAG